MGKQEKGTSTQILGRIPKVDPPILDSSTPMVYIIVKKPRIDLFFRSARGLRREDATGIPSKSDRG